MSFISRHFTSSVTRAFLFFIPSLSAPPFLLLWASISPGHNAFSWEAVSWYVHSEGGSLTHIWRCMYFCYWYLHWWLMANQTDSTRKRPDAPTSNSHLNSHLYSHEWGNELQNPKPCVVPGCKHAVFYCEVGHFHNEALWGPTQFWSLKWPFEELQLYTLNSVRTHLMSLFNTLSTPSASVCNAQWLPARKSFNTCWTSWNSRWLFRFLDHGHHSCWDWNTGHLCRLCVTNDWTVTSPVLGCFCSF